MGDAVVDLARFDQDGFLVLADVLDRPQLDRTLNVVDRLLAEAAQGRRPGKVTGGTLHLVGLEPPGLGVPRAWEDPRVAAVVGHHLGAMVGRPNVGYRAPLPGHGAQTLHVDHPGPVAPGQWAVCNALVALGDITDGCGATRFVPGSHRHPEPRFLAHGPQDRHRREVAVSVPAGSVLMFSGHVLHAGSENRGARPRHALLVQWGLRPLSPRRPPPTDTGSAGAWSDPT